MYRIIAADLDETLLQTDKHVSKKDIETIRSFTDVRFVCATGRGFGSIQGTLKELGTYDKENEYTISYNGALITENRDNRIIHLEPISYEDCEKLFNLGLKYDVCIHLYTLNECYTYRLFDEEIRYLKDRIEVKEFFDTDISFLKDKTIIKALYCNSDVNYIRKIKEELRLEDEYEVTMSANRYLEFNAKGINKGLGLRKLAEYLGVPIEETIAVGDSLNDLAMIKAAGLGIGVKNSADEIINDCDIILDSTNNDSPISEIYEKYVKKD